MTRRFTAGGQCPRIAFDLHFIAEADIHIKVQRTVILLVVSYERENWCLTSRQKYELRVFMNRVLRNVSGFKRDGGTGNWKRLHNVELHDLNMSPDTTGLIKLTTRDLWALWQVWGMGEVYRGFW